MSSKDITAAIFVFVASAVVLYWIFAFVSLDLNPVNWHVGARLLFAMLLSFAGFLVLIGSTNNDDL